MRPTARLALVLLGLCATAPAALAEDFTISFEWGDIPRCTSGYPGMVPNPHFTLRGVPAGTARIAFEMKDLDAPRYRHGGGKVAYGGESEILPGAFRYKSPCPPSGRHSYRWTATAEDAGGKRLGRANATRSYP